MSARYAIYYAPKADDPLALATASWLGRDASTGAQMSQPPFPALHDVDLQELTKSPRHYGFHATLKAPFALHQDQSEAALIEAVDAFSATFPAFDAEIAPMALSAFIAFRLTGEPDAMQALHEACVRAFEPFRAPLAAEDIARRRKAKLSALQDQRLLAFGYPYIFEDFRFHMTLTGAVPDEALRTRILSALQDHFAQLSGLHHFFGLSLFKQDNRDADFQILHQSAFKV
jgi:Protein of unknown function (DUF1045)